MLPKIRTAAVTAALTLAGVLAVPAAQATTAPTPPVTAHSIQAAEVSHGITLKAGPRLAKKSGFAAKYLGAISVAGHLGFCYDYGKARPNGRWGFGALDGVKAGPTRDQMQWIVNSRPDAIGRAVVEPAVDAALLRLRSADFRYDWAHSYVTQLKVNHQDAVIALADTLLSDAVRYAGPVAMSGEFTVKPLPGGRGTVQVKVSANGHAYPGQPLRWGLTGGQITSGSAKTHADGTAVLRFVRTGVGPVSYRVDAVSPEWSKARYSTPTSDSRQHLVRGADTLTTTTGGRFDSTLGHAITQDCTTRCDGRPPMHAEVQATGAAAQWQERVGNKVVASLTLAAGKAGTMSWVGTDGTTIAPRYRVQVAGKWSAWRTLKSFTVVCPPWPPAELTCACDGTLTVTLTPPAGSRFYSASVGSTSVPLVGRTPISIPLATGERATVTVTAYFDAARTKPIATHTSGTWIQGQ